jgi:(1->4)-alpha-D-glucan 1-alpha-D-glucosylmutase
MNAALHAADPSAPGTVDEFLFYQTVVGTLPATWLGAAELAADEQAEYVERLVAYALKAAREAKLRTSWTDRHAAYEGFVRGALARETPFLRDALAFTAQLAPLAAIHGLAQVALKLGAPGVPDTYQGCELWDYSLVDPDNRRAVDYGVRSAMLASFAQRDGDRAGLLAEMLAAWPDGRIKLYVTWRLLQLRRAHAQTFLGGGYRALVATTPSIVAFARDEIVFAVPRLARAHARGDLRVAFTDERIALGRPNATYASVLDGRTVRADAAGELAASDAFALAPLAVLVPGTR